MPETKMTATDVYKAICNRFSDTSQYAIASEVGLSTGGARRRIDVVVVNCYNSNNFRIDGIEIKVSKADLRRELENPDKHTSFFDRIDYFTLACPQDIVDLSIIPKKWGVLVVYPNGKTKYRRRPLALHDEPNRSIPRGFFAEYVRAIQHFSPSKKMLSAEYRRGLEDGITSEKRRYQYEQNRVEREAKKLKEYDNLISRLNLWSGDVEDHLNEFERFRSANLESCSFQIKAAIKSLDRVLTYLEQKEQ